MTLNFEEEIDIQFDFDYKKIAEEVINCALDSEDFPFETEVSLTLTGLDEIHECNKNFRNIDKPTDVLSFPLIEYPAAGDFSKVEEDDNNFNPETGEAMLGDIVLCIPKVIEQAKEYNHSIKREYAFLIAHSMLHLMGYDHMEDEERFEMEKKQNFILDKLHITRNQEENNE